MESDFTRAIRDVITDKDFTSQHPEGLAPVDILNEVHRRNPGEFIYCTVIDLLHEKDAVYAGI